MPVKSLALVAAALAVFTACTGARSSEPAPFGFAAIGCPRDVQIELLVPHSCGYLTVPQDRTRPDGRTVRLFVLKIPPPGEDRRSDPVLILGDDVGGLPDYGNHQAEAESLRRVVYVLDERGTGHSRPALTCPEIDRVSTEGVAEPTGDPSLHRRFLAAVKACGSSLRSNGIDPSNFDLAAMAADVEDLRRALGLPSWNLAAYGSLSRLALEVIRRYPEHVRAAFLDSPQFPQLDEPTNVALGTGLVLTELFRTCHAQPSCQSRSPTLRHEWMSAVAGLAAHPVEAHTRLGDVLVDAGSFVRGLQAAMSEDTAALAAFPGAVAAARSRRVDGAVTMALATHGALCAGYRFRCGAGFSTAVYLSVLCRDEAPIFDASALRRASNSTGSAESFGTNPYLAACSTWKVLPAGPTMQAPVTASVPVLLVSGQFDPFSPPRLTRELGHPLASSFVVEVPGMGHGPLEVGGCQIGIRDRWLDDPSSPPTGSACLRQMRLEFRPG